MLKNSLRNCTLILSVTEKFFVMPRSNCASPGARKALRPRLPNGLSGVDVVKTLPVAPIAGPKNAAML
jgi:hypothetical protein